MSFANHSHSDSSAFTSGLTGVGFAGVGLGFGVGLGLTGLGFGISLGLTGLGFGVGLGLTGLGLTGVGRTGVGVGVGCGVTEAGRATVIGGLSGCLATKVVRWSSC